MSGLVAWRLILCLNVPALVLTIGAAWASIFALAPPGELAWHVVLFFSPAILVAWLAIMRSRLKSRPALALTGGALPGAAATGLLAFFALRP